MNASRSLFNIGKRYGLLVTLLVLSLLAAEMVGSVQGAWARSPVPPVSDAPFAEASAEPDLFARVQAALTWTSPLPWFLVGLLGFGLLGWGLLALLSRLEPPAER